MVELYLKKLPFFMPLPKEDMSWERIASKFHLTLQNPGPVYADMKLLPLELRTQIEKALESGILTLKIEEAVKPLYNKKEVKSTFFSMGDFDEVRKLLKGNITLSKKGIRHYFNNADIKKLRVCYEVEIQEKKRRAILDPLIRYLKSLSVLSRNNDIDFEIDIEDLDGRHSSDSISASSS